MKKINFKVKGKILIPIIVIFAILTLILSFSWVKSENNLKRAILKARLESFTDISAYLLKDSISLDILPAGLRITVLNLDGSVKYDSYNETALFDNHSNRPEIIECLLTGVGDAIRHSETTDKDFYYYAKYYPDNNVIIRTAQDYEFDVQRFLTTDLVQIVILFLVVALACIIILYFSVLNERREAEREYQEKRKLKHEMTSNISHELKTPVSGIQGCLETVLSHPEMEEDRRNHFIDRAYAQSKRLGLIINDLSVINKLEEAPEKFDITAVNLKFLCDQIIDDMQDLLARHNIIVTNNLPPVCFDCSQYLLYSIFSNLIENSAKYAGNGTICTISVEKLEQNNVVFNYCDNGKGVPMEFHQQIFNRFVRLDRDRNNSEGGSGLGLSIVRNAVLFHNGEINSYTPQEGGFGVIFSLKAQKKY